MSMSAYSPAYNHGDSRVPETTRIGARRHSRTSWGAVLAGAIVAAASFIILSLLGVGVGAGGLHLSSAATSNAGSFGLGEGIWTAIVLFLSLLFGGYVAARLSGTHSHLDAELHGITVWGVTVLLITVLLAQAVGSLLGTVASTAGSAVGGAASSLTGAVTNAVGSPAGLVGQLQQSLTTSGDPTQMTHAQITSEIATLVGRRVVNGSLTDDQRDRLTTLVAAQSGISKDAAAHRVSDMEQQATTTLAQVNQRAREAAEATAHGAAVSARALFSGLFLSLAGALVGAWIGTRHARVLPVHHEPEFEAHTTTTVTHHAYEPVVPVTHHTAYEPVATTSPAAVRVMDDRGANVAAYLRSASFPATKQDLLRLARANNDDPAMLRRLEQVPERSYSSLQDLMSALHAFA